MPWPVKDNLNTLEKQKFVECPAGEVAVRVKQCDDLVFRPSGLTIEGRITIVTINDSSWTALPATPLENRNAISIQNQTDTEIKINFRDDVSYTGVIIAGGGERFYDITDDIIVYARSSSGDADIAIEEVA